MAEFRKTWESKTGKFDLIDKEKLQLDWYSSGYQRYNEKQAKRILRDKWKWQLAGCLTVFRRKTTGNLFIVDGGGRWIAAKEIDDIITLPCMVYDSDGPMEESYWFRLLNSRRSAVSAAEKHKAALKAKEPAAVLIDDLLANAEEQNVMASRCVASMSFEAKDEEGRARLMHVWKYAIPIWKGREFRATTLKALCSLSENQVLDWAIIKAIGPDAIDAAAKTTHGGRTGKGEALKHAHPNIVTSME